MYEEFVKHNDSKRIAHQPNDALTENLKNTLRSLFDECGGYSFQNGLYRVHHPNSSLHWENLISKYFAKYKGRIMPFGYDWMGRQFALDMHRENYILMFDPATAEDFELNQGLEEFHNKDLVYEKESALAENLFHELLKFLRLSEVAYSDCLGYKKPLLLGGTDTMDNYELSDIEVYWEFQRQIYLQTKNLPEGTKIDTIIFKSK